MEMIANRKIRYKKVLNQLNLQLCTKRWHIKDLEI